MNSYTAKDHLTNLNAVEVALFKYAAEVWANYLLPLSYMHLSQPWFHDMHAWLLANGIQDGAIEGFILQDCSTEMRGWYLES